MSATAAWVTWGHKPLESSLGVDYTTVNFCKGIMLINMRASTSVDPKDV